MLVSRRRVLLAGWPVLGAFGLGALSRAPAHAQDTPPPPRGAAFTAMYTDPRFTTWSSMVELAGLARDAEETRPYTVFAPTEAAFDNHPRLRRELVPTHSDVQADQPRLKLLVQAHVLHGLHPASGLRDKVARFQSVACTPAHRGWNRPSGVLRVEWRNAEGVTGRASLAAPAIEASNALIHPLDDVTLS